MTIENFRRVRILNSLDEEVVNIDSSDDNGSIKCRDATTNTSIFIEGRNGNMKLGGQHEDADGDIGLFPAGTNLDTAPMSDAKIHLDGDAGSIKCRDATTNTSIFIEGRNGNMKLGGQHEDGDIGLFRCGTNLETAPMSEATIHLDGNAGDIRLRNADCAEEFDLTENEEIEPGMVMCIDSNGKLCMSKESYDKRVVGIISGAGNYKPGIILDKQQKHKNRAPIALLGKVLCKVDANTSSVEYGDLLTTSDIPGYAMKASDPLRSVGSIVGKALASLGKGKSLIPIVVTLQ